MDADSTLAALDFTPDSAIDDQALALAVAHEIYKALYGGNLAILTLVGQVFDVRGHEKAQFGGLPPFDAARHATAVIVTPDGRPIVTIDAALIVRS